jgi:hypothetical protein
MSKKNSGINDRNDESGEQSHIDGNSGIANRIDGEELPDPPEEITRDQAKEFARVGKTPTKRNSNII